MKIFLLFFFIGFFTLSAQVGIGTTNPSPASMLDVTSSTNNIDFRGMMPPRVTVADRDKIPAGPDDVGLLVFINDPTYNLFCLQIWNGMSWDNVQCLSNSNIPTSVEFTSPDVALYPENGGVDLEFTIVNPSLTDDVIITVVASSYPDLLETDFETIIIPAGATTYTATGIFNILDDNLEEGNENIVFTINSIIGGTGAPSIGNQNTYTITIIDNDLRLWINEFHYDPEGSDGDEFVEVAGTAGFDITDYRIYHYNGRNGSVIASKKLNGILTDQQNGFGTLNLPFAGLQNETEGLALVDPLGNLLQFISYEGEFIATAGPAQGEMSIDVVVFEDEAPVGNSLQLNGVGSDYAEFIWVGPAQNSPGAINIGQTFN